MRDFHPRDLTLAAFVAALYAVMGYFGDVFGLTFGPVQLRFAEGLTVLPFLFPAAAPGLAVGCLITNLLSPYGPVDVVFGTLATAAAGWLTAKVPRRYLAPLPPILVNLIILPPMWSWQQTGGFGPAFWPALLMNAAAFALGQTVVCYGLGIPLLRLVDKIPALRATHTTT